MKLFLAVSFCLIVSAFGNSGSQRSPYFQKKVARYFRKNGVTQKSSKQTSSESYETDSSSFNLIRGAPRFAKTRLGVFPLAARNAMTYEERNTYLPVMKSLVKVMETRYPAPEDVNTLLVLSRDLGFLKVKGELPIPAAFGDVNIADMLLDEGDAIVNVDGLPHILTRYGAFPLSDLSLMTDEERKRYLPATKIFIKVLEKEFIDQNEINELIKRGEDLQDLMPELWNDDIIQTLNNHIGYDFDANGNIVNARRTQVNSGRVGN